METAAPLNTRTFASFVTSILTSLNRSRITYAVTGALAASYYGVPRTTVDADFLVRLSPRRLPKLLTVLENCGLRVDRARALKRLRSGYNILSFEDSLSAHIADFIIETRRRIERRKGTLLGLEVFYEAPESLILAKLRMIKATRPVERAQKDREDIKVILAQTKVDKRKIIAKSKRQGTYKVLSEVSVKS